MRTVGLLILSLGFTAHAAPPLSGGDTTIFETGGSAFARPLANISRENRRAHSVGNSFFNQNWVEAPASTAARDGLGPLFNARSCSACHVKDGRDHPPFPGEAATRLVMRLSLPDGSPLPHYGFQFSPRAITATKPDGWITVEYEEDHHLTAAGWPITRRWPTYTFGGFSHGELPAGTLTSPRIAPAVHGLGLLEAIPDATLRALADPDDSNQDGISGRLNIVPDLINGGTAIGRFGWKANEPSLRQQAAAAFAGDLGITTTLFPDASSTPPEADDKILDRIETYLQTLAPPAQRNHTDPQILLGEQVFHHIGCAACHTSELNTGPHSITELANQTIHPYTDLLLHDMAKTSLTIAPTTSPPAPSGAPHPSGASVSNKPSTATSISSTTAAPMASKKPSTGTAAKQKLPNKPSPNSQKPTTTPSSLFYVLFDPVNQKEGL